jgi:hypothetical protein
VTDGNVVLANTDPAQLAIQRLADGSAATLQRSVRETVGDGDLSDAELDEIRQILAAKLAAYYTRHGRVSAVSRTRQVLLGNAGPDDDFQKKAVPATVVMGDSADSGTPSSSSHEADVALISIEQSPLPTVKLGNATELAAGQEIFVVGYPALGVDELFGERTTALGPTLTSGVVTGRKTLDSGVSTIQTDAALPDGTTGGPIYNRNGEVVGVATADSETDRQFGLPIEVAKSRMQRAGIKTLSSDLDTAFDAGLDAYWHGDCETATEQMQTVLDMYPGHPSAQLYIDDCAGETVTQ